MLLFDFSKTLISCSRACVRFLKCALHYLHPVDVKLIKHAVDEYQTI